MPSSVQTMSRARPHVQGRSSAITATGGSSGRAGGGAAAAVRSGDAGGVADSLVAADGVLMPLVLQEPYQHRQPFAAAPVGSGRLGPLSATRRRAGAASTQVPQGEVRSPCLSHSRPGPPASPTGLSTIASASLFTGASTPPPPGTNGSRIASG